MHDYDELLRKLEELKKIHIHSMRELWILENAIEHNSLVPSLAEEVFDKLIELSISKNKFLPELIKEVENKLTSMLEQQKSLL